MKLNCKECNCEFITNNKKRIFCSRQCSNKQTSRIHKETRKGEGNPSWKGGRNYTIQGYVRIYKPEHPNSDVTHGTVLEHRLVMEKVIGRYLAKDETVHHKNGIRDDNRPQNLELWVGNHPATQRVADLLSWAKEILLRYEPKSLRLSSKKQRL